ncbi:MAG: alkaline phosphatase family protein [Oscillospiraceae bacterium]|nr:alkaline phosphatase family protein [Oscillospiraceae bacterium]
MEILYPDYDNCIANLSCSVMKHFGVTPPNPGLSLADSLLSERRYKNVVVLLLDGMGNNIIEANLAPDGFFRSHLVGTYSSVFPPTTVAATTAMDSGLFPVQSAWLGWSCYFPEVDENIEYFVDINGERLAWKYVPYWSIYDRIKDAGFGAHYRAPFTEPYPEDFGAFCREIKRLCAEDGEKYIHAYWDQPDTVMHRKGCFGESAKTKVRELEKAVEELANELTDTLLLITADHGHIDSPKAVVTHYPDIMECLVRMPSIEPRCLNLFVKDGMEEQLKAAFKEHFDGKFMLMSKAEVKERQLFGKGAPHPHFDGMLGDYIAVAIDDVSIYNMDSKNFVGAHAGLTKDEMIIPLIAVKKD